MEAAFTWVSQGDVFTAVPQIWVEFREDHLEGTTDIGPALLVTHSCHLDKVRRDGGLHIQRVQFVRLLDLDEAPEAQRATLRRGDINPPEAFYVGEMSEGWEGYVLLSQLFTLPVAYFEPRIESFAGAEGADPDRPEHLVFGRHGERIGRLDDEALELLHQKMARFWMRAGLRAAGADA